MPLDTSAHGNSNGENSSRMGRSRGPASSMRSYLTISTTWSEPSGCRRPICVWIGDKIGTNRRALYHLSCTKPYHPTDRTRAIWTYQDVFVGQWKRYRCCLAGQWCEVEAKEYRYGLNEAKIKEHLRGQEPLPSLRRSLHSFRCRPRQGRSRPAGDCQSRRNQGTSLRLQVVLPSVYAKASPSTGCSSTATRPSMLWHGCDNALARFPPPSAPLPRLPLTCH